MGGCVALGAADALVVGSALTVAEAAMLAIAVGAEAALAGELGIDIEFVTACDVDSVMPVADAETLVPDVLTSGAVDGVFAQAATQHATAAPEASSARGGQTSSRERVSGG
jgi:hypothetical protein